jgi:hypothetical protein
VEQYRTPHGQLKGNLFLPLYNTNFISKFEINAGKGTRHFNPQKQITLQLPMWGTILFHSRELNLKFNSLEWNNIVTHEQLKENLYLTTSSLETIRNTNIGRIKIEKNIRIGQPCPVLAELNYLYHKGSFRLIYVNITVVIIYKMYKDGQRLTWFIEFVNNFTR